MYPKFIPQSLIPVFSEAPVEVTFLKRVKLKWKLSKYTGLHLPGHTRLEFLQLRAQSVCLNSPSGFGTHLSV